jgi:hypothetical protein
MGCIARLGCLIVLVCLAVVGWFTRDRWLPARFRPHSAATTQSARWEPLSPAGAARAQTALTKLAQPTGPAFQTLSSSDLASYAMGALSRQLAGTVDSVETRVSGDTVAMRGVVQTAKLGGLGSIASMLSDRERVQLAGTFRVIEPGVAEFQVREVHIGSVPIPSGMIPELLKRMRRGPTPPGTSANALPVPIPKSVGDIRVARGKVTLYKSGQ